MNTEKIVQDSIAELHQEHRKSPWGFLIEADCQCFLYSCLLKRMGPEAPIKVQDAKKKERDRFKGAIKTKTLHSEFPSTYERRKSRVDLCIIDPAAFHLEVSKRFDNNLNRGFSDWWFTPESAIGIELKFNLKGNKRGLSEFNYLERGMVKDLKKLSRYRKGFLVLVDPLCVFRKKKEWAKYTDTLFRKARVGKNRKKLVVYYISAKNKNLWM